MRRQRSLSRKRNTQSYGRKQSIAPPAVLILGHLYQYASFHSSSKSTLILSTHIRLDLPSRYFPSGVISPAFLLSPMRVIRPAHLISLLSIPLIIFGEKCSFLHMIRRLLGHADPTSYWEALLISTSDSGQMIAHI